MQCFVRFTPFLHVRRVYQIIDGMILDHFPQIVLAFRQQEILHGEAKPIESLVARDKVADPRSRLYRTVQISRIDGGNKSGQLQV